ncbi:hypothetical protein AB4Z42_22845 [Mycobacterium sp. 2YAF39]|uniref:hypothetical protein n=1 Tax=Mycobacterium sp. 2YAF39 TaxID=3233033 RepID=UPI003F98F4A7
MAPLADGSEQAVAQAIEAVTTFPAELDPRIWKGTQMKSEVRDASLRVVDRIVADAGIEGLTVTGVDLFGSNASYEYDDASDFGVHVFVTAESMTSAELSPILNLLNDDVERRQEGRIRFYGVPVEVSFHTDRSESYQPQPGVGQYSITEGRWVVMPTKQPDNFDRTQMTADIEGFIAKYNDLVLAYQKDSTAFECTRFSALDEEMAVYRNESFEAGLGSRSTHNLAYRALRRLNVSIPDMVDTLEDECTFVKESLR